MFKAMPIKRLFPFIDLFLIAIAVYIAVNGTYAFLTSRLDILPPSSEVRSVAPSDSSVDLPPLSDYQIIDKRNLFHTKTDTETETKPVIDSLEETKADLKLWGTIAGDSENSYAIIENLKDKTQNPYKQGDMVQTSVKVKLIMTDRVVLSVSGQDEVLTLQDSTTSSTTSSTRSSSTSSSSTTTSVQTSRIRLSRSQVNSALENITDLVSQITVTPYNKDGQEGMKLSNIKANSIFRRMGLRNGDILTAVDGQPLTSVDQAYKLYEDLKSSDTASVQIIRRNKTRNYQYTIK